MRQLVKRIVKCSVSLGAHARDCIVSKAKVNVIRRIVSVECVRIARKWERKNKKHGHSIEMEHTPSYAWWNFVFKIDETSEKAVPLCRCFVNDISIILNVLSIN